MINMGCLEMRNINLVREIMFTNNITRYVQFERALKKPTEFCS